MFYCNTSHIHVSNRDTIKGSVFCIFVGNRNVFYYYWSVSNDLVSRAVPMCCQFCHLITKLTIDGFLRTLNTIDWSHVFAIWNNGLWLIFPYVQNVLYPPSLLDRMQIFKLLHRSYLEKYRQLWSTLLRHVCLINFAWSIKMSWNHEIVLYIYIYRYIYTNCLG